MDNTYDIANHPTLNETYRYPLNTIEGGFPSALKYNATERDLFVCTYPKCGTTWLQTIIWLIKKDGDISDEEFTKIRKSLPFLDFDGEEQTRSTDDGKSLHLVKTHFPYKWIPKHSNAKYIFCVRNPKDACTSLYYHIVGFQKYYKINATFDQYFDAFIEGRVDASDYFFTTEEYHEHRNDENALFLLYEDMKMDLRSAVLKIAKFIGQDHFEKLTADEKLLNKIVEEASFDSMQKKTTSFHNADRPAHLPFVRKGVIGDWKNLLSDEQSKRIDEKLKKYNIANLWEAYKEFL